ncbi:hypothetical protein SK128_010085, partial [Halocaridina rubra]
MSEDMTEFVVQHITTCNAITIVDESSPPTEFNRTLQELQATARADPAHGHPLTCVSSRFPSNSSILPYWKIRVSLHTVWELNLCGQWIIVPATFLRRTQARLHDSHRGVETTKSLMLHRLCFGQALTPISRTQSLP